MSAPAGGSAAEVCPHCAQPWIEGRIGMPIVGGLRFVYRLGTNEVATEVAARMCAGCGHVQLRARQPELIGRAARAARSVPDGRAR